MPDNISQTIPLEDMGSDRTFSPVDLAFVFAWVKFLPGLCAWTVILDTDDDGAEFLTVDPPLVYGTGFSIFPDGEGVVIEWAGGSQYAATLREGIMLICPLAPAALATVEALTASFMPAMQPDANSR